MYNGIGVSAGISISQCLLRHSSIQYDSLPRQSSLPNLEIARFKIALQNLLKKNEGFRVKIMLQLGEAEAAIFEAYEMMLTDDDNISLPIIENIIKHNLTAEFAVAKQLNILAKQFTEIDDNYMKDRAEDILNLRDQLLHEISGQYPEDMSCLNHPAIIVARRLSPADMASLDTKHLAGIICADGSYSSHASILARTLGIPTVVGAKNIIFAVNSGDLLALNGATGEVWQNPSMQVQQKLRSLANPLA